MDKDLKIIHNNDVRIDVLKSMKIGVIGYGNQGRAQALNLKDRELKIKIGLRDNSKSIELASEDGFVSDSIDKVVQWADLISILVPDKEMSIVYRNDNIRRKFTYFIHKTFFGNWQKGISGFIVFKLIQ